MTLNIQTHNDILNKLYFFVERNRIPNIIFHGECGSGKKTLLKKFLNKIYENNTNSRDYIMYVNCAYGKGIKFIRDELKFFAKTNINEVGIPFKSIILLNSDKLTIDAQSALRRCIEVFSNNTRFFIIIENKDKLLLPILSRFCEIYVPNPIVDSSIVNLHILNKKIKEEDKPHYKIKQKMIKAALTGGGVTPLNPHTGGVTPLNPHIGGVTPLNNKHIFKGLTPLIEKLYEKGISCLDLLEYIKNNLEENKKKYEFILHMNKIKNEIRNEKLLMFYLITFYKMRNENNLENIYIL